MECKSDSNYHSIILFALQACLMIPGFKSRRDNIIIERKPNNCWPNPEGVIYYFHHYRSLINNKHHCLKHVPLPKNNALEILNRKAHHDYFFDQTYIAGMVLAGTEIKSLRAGKASFNDSYCIFSRGELFVKSLHISEYAFGTYTNHEPMQERKLLLNKKELRKLEGKTKEKGYSIIPLRIFLAESGYFKMEIGLGKGKKHYDKRETIKERETDRDIKRRFGV